MSLWTHPLTLLRDEVPQARDEGAEIPSDLLARIAALGSADEWSSQLTEPLYDELDALPRDAALAAAEPDGFDEIRALRPPGPRDLGWAPDEADLVDLLHGAWTGRAAGNSLGKPVEHMSLLFKEGRPVGRALLREYLEHRGDWPLADFVSGRDVGDGMAIMWPRSQREHIAFTEQDDDIHYTLTGLGVLEVAGPGFGWRDVAQYWLAHIPVDHICTAEAQAVMNLMNHSARVSLDGWGVALTRNNPSDPAQLARHRNPYREWIGAQIRADGWAYACAGHPELAAELAWRDACWTHTRNGIYGEMFMAALQAAAFVEHDAERLVEIGLSEIPEQSRLARVLRWTLERCADGAVDSDDGFEAAVTDIEAHCHALAAGAPVEVRDDALPNPDVPLVPTAMRTVHTIINAALCVAALCGAGGDPDRGITRAVRCGYDTDCNGASIGSVVGAGRGRREFGGVLAPRLHDTIRPAMVGFSEVTMKELAERHATVWQQVRDWSAARAAGVTGPALAEPRRGTH